MVYHFYIGGRKVGKMTLANNLIAWREATQALPWGAQRALHTTLEAVKDNGVHLVHGADYRNGKPCLINAAGAMLSSHVGVSEGEGHGVPSSAYGAVVRLFDAINRDLADKSVNDASGYVSPLAAEVLLRHFGPLKDDPEVGHERINFTEAGPYVEPSDSELAQSWLDAMSAPAPEELYEPAKSPVDGFNKDFIKAQVQHGIFDSNDA